jgi:hypothetical protein
LASGVPEASLSFLSLNFSILTLSRLTWLGVFFLFNLAPGFPEVLGRWATGGESRRQAGSVRSRGEVNEPQILCALRSYLVAEREY